MSQHEDPVPVWQQCLTWVWQATMRDSLLAVLSLGLEERHLKAASPQSEQKMQREAERLLLSLLETLLQWTWVSAVRV